MAAVAGGEAWGMLSSSSVILPRCAAAPVDLPASASRTMPRVPSVLCAPSGALAPERSVRSRLVHALDAACITGPSGVPSLEPAVRAYVADCRQRSMSVGAALAALEALAQMYGCHRGPGHATGALSACLARWGRDAYASAE